MVGLAASILGLVILVRRVFRTGTPPWAPVAVAALLAGSLTEDGIAATAPAWRLVRGADLPRTCRRTQGDILARFG